MKEYSHYILTRFNTQLVNGVMLYDDPVRANDWMRKRMELFRETKKSVLSQEGNFRWIISVDKRTPDDFIYQMMDYKVDLVFCDIRDAFKEIEVDTPWVITTRLDCDDILKPGFVQRIQDHFEPKLKVLDVRFEELDPDRGKVYAGERRWAGSMFISLIEKSDWITTAFCRPHGMVAGGYPTGGSWDNGWEGTKIIQYQIIEENLAYMVCHGNNIANRIRGEYLRDL